MIQHPTIGETAFAQYFNGAPNSNMGSFLETPDHLRSVLAHEKAPINCE